MRVLLLNYEFPPLGGGAATASAQIARHMARRGVEVVVLTSHFRGLEHKEHRDGYTVYRVPAMRRRIDRCTLPEMGSFIPGASIPAVRLASSFRPDLMHVFFGMPTGPVGLIVNRLKGIPYLLSLRGDDVPGRQSGALALAHRVMRPLTRQVWGRAAALVVNGEGLLKRAERTLPGRPIELIPNGVDLEAFRPGEARTGALEGTVRLLFVGRLHRQKGLAYLLQALAQLEPDMRERVRLELVGSGPDEETLRATAAQLGLAGAVRFSGWVSRESILAHYRSADVFVFPSFEEGMPNVVLEAMACGKPVIASDIEGVRGLVQPGTNGLLVHTANADALAQALRTLISDGILREQMGSASRTLASRMDWGYVAERYLALSERIIMQNAKHKRQNAKIANQSRG